MPCHAMPERNKTAQDCDTAGAVVMMQPAVLRKLNMGPACGVSMVSHKMHAQTHGGTLRQHMFTHSTLSALSEYKTKAVLSELASNAGG